MRKVCVFIGSRANYSSIKSVLRAVREHDGLRLQLIVGASALLDRFGSVVDVIEADGFTPDARVTMIVEGETPATMAKSTGLGRAARLALPRRRAARAAQHVGNLVAVLIARNREQTQKRSHGRKSAVHVDQLLMRN